ncbi:hypothetical protein BGZ95_004736 [Linnemannia exigua]|uniref:Uncharacterized protein n=1 Tax=Linnemannia exigua TaxID=604196 RepID=A0AAD4D2P0_9FUNG|nr:hypothetical protein BGZ95_004736 [Linnemannia exigua]
MSAPPSYSKLPAPHYLQSPRVCCITLNEGDKIRLIGVPTELVAHLRAGINRSWTGKISREQDYNGAHEFKMHGNPWVAYGIDHVPARRLILEVFRIMAKHGWNLVQSADVSKKHMDKDSLFFETVDPNSVTGLDLQQVDMFCISFGSSDKLRVIEGSQEVVAVVRQAIQAQWKHGIQRDEVRETAQEFKLVGTPWYPSGDETVLSRMMLSQVLANLRALGYKLYTSVDISTGSGDNRDTDSWVFRRVGNAWS